MPEENQPFERRHEVGYVRLQMTYDEQNKPITNFYERDTNGNERQCVYRGRLREALMQVLSGINPDDLYPIREFRDEAEGARSAAFYYRKS
jgi:hypothetical protein